jgi:protein-arginine kinase activator protein McsA
MSERSAFEVNFSKDVTILAGPNGTGKSAALKSLYYTFGAIPHKIDRSWKRAAVSSLVEFDLDGQRFAALRSRDRYAIYDLDRNEALIDTSSVSKNLAPFLAELLNFGLIMPDQKNNLVIPPPAYAFAPFYVDQDGGWTKPWSSFEQMYLPKSRQTLASYHTGIRTNSYYEAMAERDALLHEIRECEERRETLQRAIEEIAKVTSDLAIDLSMSSFEDRAEELANKSAALNKNQAEYRRNLSRLSSEKAIWEEQHSLLQATLREMEKTVTLATKYPEHIDCPTCGQSYENSIADRFGLIAEYDDIFEAIQDGIAQVSRIEREIGHLKGSLAKIDAQILQIDQILAVESDGVSLGDVISAQGRNETSGILRQAIDQIDQVIGAAQGKLKIAEQKRREAANPDRARSINSQFDRLREKFSIELDAPLYLIRDGINSPKLARGSAGTRELLAYYLAVLFSAREHSGSTFCPIVIDAPNQQGQDSHHLALIYRFLSENRPGGTQMIFSAEEPEIEDSDDVEVIYVNSENKRLLQEKAYDHVFDYMKEYLDIFL